MFVCGGIVYLALHHTTAANATLIYTASNVMILIFEWLFRGRPIGLREIIGTVLAVSGVAVVALGSEGWRLALNPGDALIGVAATAWAVYSVLLKRPSLTKIPGQVLFAAIVLTGATMLVPMTAMGGRDRAGAAADWPPPGSPCWPSRSSRRSGPTRVINTGCGASGRPRWR